MPAKFIVETNLSVLSLMSITALPNELTLSHRAVTPLRAAPPMKLPKADALAVAFWNAFTASSLLPVILTDIIALCPMRRLLYLLGFGLDDFNRCGPVHARGFLSPLPRRPAEIAGQ